MYVPERYYEEASHGLTAVLATHPDLTAEGWDYAPKPPSVRSEHPKRPTPAEVATALAFLDLSGARAKARAVAKDPTSYYWKHVAERWGQTAGLSPYVSNGAFIVALILRRVPFRRWPSSGPNCTPALTRPWNGLRPN